MSALLHPICHREESTFRGVQNMLREGQSTSSFEAHHMAGVQEWSVQVGLPGTMTIAGPAEATADLTLNLKKNVASCELFFLAF
jgi:hypothetical protein